MKKILSLCTLMAALSSPIVAQDDNMRRTDEADYTVIEFIVGGGNLDISELGEMSEMIEGDMQTGQHVLLGNSINIVGLHKPSAAENQLLEEVGLGGTRIFETVCQSHEAYTEFSQTVKEILSQCMTEDDITPEVNATLYASYYSTIKQAPYADASFDFNDVNSIAAALKELKERYPAKQYIFMANGHGEGWNAADCIDYVAPGQEGESEDEPEAGKRRAMLVDDNLNGAAMGLDQLVAAAQLADIHFQLIFDDLCLMSTWENLYGYAQIADYAMTSVEMTTGCNMYPFIMHLAAAAGDGQKLFDEMSDYIQSNEYHYFVDYSYFTNEYPTMEEVMENIMYGGMQNKPEMANAIDDEEEEDPAQEPSARQYQDMGIYDLSKISTVSPILKNIQAWYCQNYSSKTYIIESGILHAVRNYGSLEISEEVIADDFDNFLNWLAQNNQKELFSQYFERIVCTHFQLVFADVVCQTVAKGKEEGIDVSELEALYDQYIAALKDMSSIKCSYAPFDEPDYVYRTCSPSVIMYSLNPETCPTKQSAYSEYSYWNFSQEKFDATSEAYKASLFDQDVKWSEFLSMLEAPVTPAMVHSRQWHLTFDAEDVPTAIQQIGQSSATVSYDLFGRQLSNDCHGLSISGGKVVVK